MVYSLPQLVRGVEPTLTAWVHVHARRPIALVRQLFHMHPAALVTICLLYRPVGGGHGGGSCLTAVYSNFPPRISLSRLCSLPFQVFVNFAREQHPEDDCHVYDNHVDIADELALRPVHEEGKV